MKILTLKSLCIGILLVTISNIKIIAQENRTTVVQDVKFEQILNEKRKINSSITISDIYKIQLYFPFPKVANLFKI